MVDVALHGPREACTAIGAVHLANRELIPGFSIAGRGRHRLPTARTRRTVRGVCCRALGGLVEMDVASHDLGFAPRDVRRAIALACVGPVSRLDCTPKRDGKTSRIVVLNPVEHNLVPLYEVIDVHSQVRGA
jgi:hypothetical protein